MAAIVYTVCAFHPYVQPDAPYRAGDTILEVLPATVWSSMIAELQLIHRACCRVDARVLDTTKSEENDRLASYKDNPEFLSAYKEACALLVLMKDLAPLRISLLSPSLTICQKSAVIQQAA